MTRRQILAILAGAAALLGLKPFMRGVSGGGDSDEIDATVRHLLGALGPQESAAIVGAAVLPLLPAGTATEPLVRDIARTLGHEPDTLAEMIESDLRTQLQALVRAEHLAGETLTVRGWQLALTEARLYALASLG